VPQILRDLEKLGSDSAVSWFVVTIWWQFGDNSVMINRKRWIKIEKTRWDQRKRGNAIKSGDWIIRKTALNNRALLLRRLLRREDKRCKKLSSRIVCRDEIRRRLLLSSKSDMMQILGETCSSILLSNSRQHVSLEEELESKWTISVEKKRI
jgi:hypothetical protein